MNVVVSYGNYISNGWEQKPKFDGITNEEGIYWR